MREVYLCATTGCTHQWPLAVVVLKTPPTGQEERGRVPNA